MLTLLGSDNMKLAIVLGVLIILLVSGCTTGQFINKDECSTLEDIAFNLACDNKEVTVSGMVYNVEHKVSQKGNSYMTFYLEEDGWEVTVFKFGYVDIVDSQCVIVSGTYKIINEVSGYTFHNEVVATSVKECF